MNKGIWLLGCFLFSVLIAAAQADYKVVFDLTSKDSIDQKTVIRWLNEVIKASPDAQMEVVMYGQGTAMVVKGRSLVADEITRLAANKNVSFRVCAVALKNQNIDPGQLLSGVQTVPDGIYEVISKQREGWGYIKVKN
ncbi:MAG TPA: DsrE family protein [Flavisolibacter sp.]|nr:DsrE family protein [Flavisolibacter sp.]